MLNHQWDRRSSPLPATARDVPGFDVLRCLCGRCERCLRFPVLSLDQKSKNRRLLSSRHSPALSMIRTADVCGGEGGEVAVVNKNIL